MATNFNDCSSLTGWTEEGIVGGTDYSVSAGTITGNSSNQECLTNDTAGSTADGEIVFKAKVGSISTTHHLGILRQSDSGSQTTLAGYLVALRSTGLRVSYKNSGGAVTTVTTATISTRSNDTYYWIRFRVNSSGPTSVKARIWADGDSEPGTWDVDATDSSGPTGSGKLGFVLGIGATAHTWDSAGFGTAGDTAPTSAGGGVTVAVPAGSLTLTGNAPTVTATANKLIAVPAGALTLTGFAPTVVTPRTVAVPAGALTLTAFAPTVRVGADKIVSVPTGSLSLTALAPTVTTTANVSVSVPAAALTLTGYAPTVLASGVIPEPSSGPTPAGRAKRVRRRYVVEIDGKDFEVGSPDEALDLLQKAKEQAEELAAKAVERASKAIRRPTRKIISDAKRAMPVPDIVAPPEIADVAGAVLEQIRSIYADAMQSVEISALMAKRDREIEQDDEEVLLLLI